MNHTICTRALVLAVSSTTFLSGCAMHQAGGQMGNMMAGGHPMHKMMQELGCAHAPMDMAAMKAMTPEQHQAMMSKHVADCKTKLQREANQAALARLDQCMAAHRSKGRRMKHHQMTAALRDCVQQGQAAPESLAPAHQGH